MALFVFVFCFVLFCFVLFCLWVAFVVAFVFVLVCVHEMISV